MLDALATGGQRRGQMSEKTARTHIRIGGRGADILYRKQRGEHIFRCPKGLWYVASTDYGTGAKEALHYFTQYEADGEYDNPPKP